MKKKKIPIRNFTLYKKYTGHGQSLLELLFAVAVISMIVVGVVGLSTRTVSNESFSQNKTLATEYGQQVNEWIRSERDEDWITFSALGSSSGEIYCLADLSWTSSGSCGPSNQIPGTIFIRETTLTLTDPDTMNVVVSVSWDDSQGNHEVRSDTMLTNWRR